VRRPQRPGVQCAPKRALSNPPAIHPRESPGTADSAAISGRSLKTSHACIVGTLLEGCIARNRKFALSCEETVEEWDSLWKQKEKTVENLPSTLAVIRSGASGRISSRAIPYLATPTKGN
jgi:hypothetical protein